LRVRGKVGRDRRADVVTGDAEAIMNTPTNSTLRSMCCALKPKWIACLLSTWHLRSRDEEMD